MVKVGLVIHAYKILLILAIVFAIAMSGKTSDFVFNVCDSYEFPFSGDKMNHMAHDNIITDVCAVFYNLTFGPDLTVR